ncbi:MAG: prepilin-type N-terminal cleavage/methylation domain-containing protein [Patescibacteria group bacterium]
MFHVSRFKFYDQAGFTLIEIIVVVVILGILATVAISNFALQKQETDLSGNAQDVVNILRLAQSKTLASTSNSQYGVYFDSSASPNKYVLFKGASYASRDSSYDINYSLPSTMEFFSVSFGGGNEVVFDKLTGTTAQSGSLSVKMKLDTGQSKNIFVSNSGSIDLSASIAPSDSSRTKDSRHVHLDYSRQNFINCPATNATLSLYFNGASSPQQTVSICSNLVSGQLKWKGAILVAGSNQTIEIDTHHLNDINYTNGTQFSLHRDRRSNNKSLRVTISGDNTGNLIDYSDDGLTTIHTSSYVSNSLWQ